MVDEYHQLGGDLNHTIIEYLTSTYRFQKKILNDKSKSLHLHSKREILYARKIVVYIEGEIHNLEGKYRFILERDFCINNRSKKKSVNMSSSTYFRCRLMAYEMLINNIEKKI